MADRFLQNQESVADRLFGGRVRAMMDLFDPRTRIVVAALFVLLAVAAQRPITLGVALAAGLVGLRWCGLRVSVVAVRLAPINVVMLLLVLVLPWTLGQSALIRVGQLQYTSEGLQLAGLIALKGNLILVLLTVLLGTLDITTLGHALSHLRVPEKLIHLLLFTVRYIDVLYREYRRMAAAMKVRAFRPRVDVRTYAAYGHLVGMLLVRSLDRSERILAAMKCRGFRGRFYLLDHFVFSRRDVYFAIAAALVLAVLAAVEWA